MVLDRRPTPGAAVTWVAPSTDAVAREDRGTFVDFDGGPDSYVVEFGPGRTFCCRAEEVRVDRSEPVKVDRRHSSKS